MKHTPGPWTTSVGVIGQTKVWDAEGRFNLAQAWPRTDGDWNAADEEAAANTRLIASAPELLRVLTRAVQAHGPFGDDTRPEWWDEACGAIARATS